MVVSFSQALRSKAARLLDYSINDTTVKGASIEWGISCLIFWDYSLKVYMTIPPVLNISAFKSRYRTYLTTQRSLNPKNQKKKKNPANKHIYNK